jgi:hypothetical protein
VQVHGSQAGQDPEAGPAGKTHSELVFTAVPTTKTHSEFGHCRPELTYNLPPIGRKDFLLAYNDRVPTLGVN